jgi:LmbE family N-acetylglucosaminyl deacetylase
VPHPDDEALSMGGLIQRQVAAGVEVIVLAVTDGEAAYDRSGDLVLAQARCAEQEQAMAMLTGRSVTLHRLGVPDASVAQHEDAVVDALDEVLNAESFVVAPWSSDHHADHEACGRAAERAAHVHDVPLVGALFWAWHHDALAAVDGRRLLALQLSADESRCKLRSIRCHRSQTQPWSTHPALLDPTNLAVTTWNEEYYIGDVGLW